LATLPNAGPIVSPLQHLSGEEERRKEDRIGSRRQDAQCISLKSIWKVHHIGGRKGLICLTKGIDKAVLNRKRKKGDPLYIRRGKEATVAWSIRKGQRELVSTRCKRTTQTRERGNRDPIRHSKKVEKNKRELNVFGQGQKGAGASRRGGGFVCRKAVI